MDPGLWIIPVAALGALVGSFLNVVIFRLPLGLSVSRPRWSFCPHCRHPIRPTDNVPVLSWLALRGRCRDCSRPIGAVYPLIECLTVLLFVLVWDAFFVAGEIPASGVIARDWPLAVAYLALFGGLLASSAMDIEAYAVDIRVSVVVILVGVGCHALRGMPGVTAGPVGTLPPAMSLLGVAMGCTWLATVLIGARLVRGSSGLVASDDDAESMAAGHLDDVLSESQTAYTNAAQAQFRPVPIVALGGAVGALMAWQVAWPDGRLVSGISAGDQRGLVACFLVMLVLILASMVTRESDDRIIQAIEGEREEARSRALHEFAWVLPAGLVGVVLLVIMRWRGLADTGWQDALGGIPPDAGTWLTHAAGAFHALAVAVLASALGWTVRILGTLAFGKEAFGTGDIYLMAAMGAVAGFWFVVFAFFLAALLALVGVLATLFHKRSRAIPFGPWLSLGALTALWLQGDLLQFFQPAGALLWSVLSGAPLSVGGG